ncbi:MAG: RbsD/FucU family protein [Fimbriimonadaceae bacterium]|nr:RbsD/FucU family protein [Fimbriimonadaceae bacterium]
MLIGSLQHPDVLRALAAAGHGSRIAITDGNFPVATEHGPHATVVYLNLARGAMNVTQVLQALVQAVPIERATGMTPSDGTIPEIFNEYRAILGDTPLDPRPHAEFKRLVASPDVCLHIATGETRLYACVLLTIGVVNHPA